MWESVEESGKKWLKLRLRKGRFLSRFSRVPRLSAHQSWRQRASISAFSLSRGTGAVVLRPNDLYPASWRVCFALPAQCLGNEENRIDGTSILGQSLSKNRDGFCRGCGYGCQRQTAGACRVKKSMRSFQRDRSCRIGLALWAVGRREACGKRS